uniref:(S)-ureidoglycine aminohydrolase cupin domain-containing protein n=1 Tax=Alexandrium monilatum TaxID=311494 RepID=A0A7S4VJK0_9DINO
MAAVPSSPQRLTLRMSLAAVGGLGALGAAGHCTFAALPGALRVPARSAADGADPAAQGSLGGRVGSSAPCSPLGVAVAAFGLAAVARVTSARPGRRGALRRSVGLAATAQVDVEKAKKELELQRWAASTLAAKGSPQAEAAIARLQAAKAAYEAAKAQANGEVAKAHVNGAAAPAPGAAEVDAEVMELGFAHRHWFDIASQSPKGVRPNADKGTPSCAGRSLYHGGNTSVGAWSCSPGGFPVVNRPTTEVFYVLEGEGFLTDADGTAHCFRAGDMVVLPKGWSGRWDILKTVNKIYVVNACAEDLSAEESRSALVGPPEMFVMSQLRGKGPRKSDWGEPEDFTRPMVKLGSTAVGAWACTPGGFEGTSNRPTTEWFHVLEGSGFLTNLDGTARRFGPGSTVILPKGWSGRWDVLETVRKVWVVVSNEP